MAHDNLNAFQQEFEDMKEHEKKSELEVDRSINISPIQATNQSQRIDNLNIESGQDNLRVEVELSKVPEIES